MLPRLLRYLLLATLLASAWVRPATAQQPVAEHEMKAAYILNFIQFIEWPSDSPGGARDWSLCVSAFSALMRPLHALHGRELSNGQQLRIRLFDPGNAHDCRVLVLQGSDLEQAPNRALLARRGILILSDDPAAWRAGVMIGLSEHGGRIVFDVDNAAATRAGLVISSRLLRLARTVR